MEWWEMGSSPSLYQTPVKGLGLALVPLEEGYGVKVDSVSANGLASGKILAGDHVTRINGRSTSGLSLGQISDMLRAKNGLNLNIKRGVSKIPLFQVSKIPPWDWTNNLLSWQGRNLVVKLPSRC